MSRTVYNSRDTARPKEQSSAVRPGPSVVLEVNAAYNRENLPIPAPNGANGSRVLNMEMLMSHQVFWDWMNERETEEVLMDLYIARTRLTQ